MEYKCLKCETEFEIDAMDLLVCPECRARDYDCMPLWKYRAQQKIEDSVDQPEVVEVPTDD